MGKIIDDELFKYIYDQIILLNNINVPTEDATEEEKVEYKHTKEVIEYYINDICNKITIKTNRERFPRALYTLVIDMVNNIFSVYTSDTTTDNQNIQSMSETGRSITFGESDNQKVKYQSLIERELADNEILINRYKLLYRTRCPYEQDKF